ncbi:MAG: alpha/beta hydrolase [Dehalococcoidia bacterium]
MNLKEASFNASKVNVNYAEGPDNGPPMVLIHGLSGRWQNWMPVIPSLVGSWHVYAMDLRGHGLSGRADGYRFNDYPLEVVALVRDVIGERSFLVGHSLGAIAALGVAAVTPELVRAAVLEDPPLYTHRRFNGSNFAPRFRQIHDLLTSGAGEDQIHETLVREHPGADPATLAGRAASLAQADPAVYEAVISGRSTVDYDVEKVMRKVTAPVLLLQANPGMGGALEDQEAERAAALVQGCQLVKWRESGHNMHVSKPNEFATLVKRFFAARI